MNTVEVIKKHLFECETEFIFNIAKHLNISPENIQIVPGAGNVIINGQSYSLSTIERM